MVIRVVKYSLIIYVLFAIPFGKEILLAQRYVKINQNTAAHLGIYATGYAGCQKYIFQNNDSEKNNLFSRIKDPVLFKGNDHTAYRYPAVIYYQNTFYLYFTLVEIEQEGKIFSCAAMSTSTNLCNWSPVKKITPRNQKTYPSINYTRNQMPRYGDKTARIYIMRSNNLLTWSDPELLMVKGENTPVEKMSRMIDSSMVADKDIAGKWWCFFDTDVSNMSYSYDFKNWTYFGFIESGENASVIVDSNEYILFHSPKNGIGIKKSKDLILWEPYGKLIIPGQKEWKWAKGSTTD